MINTIIRGDCIDMLPRVPDASVDLVIADPPYFKVVGEKWDYEWRTEADYVAWCERWITEIARVTKRTSSFYIFGYIHVLSMLIPVIEKHGFLFRQQIVIDKGMKAVAGRHTSTYKMFPTVTESILFFVKDARPYVRDVLREARERAGLTAKEINEKLGVKSNGGGMWTFYAGDNILASIPTEDAWDKLCEVLDIDVPYREIAFTFNVQMGVTDVWNDINFYKDERKHRTQKPRKLMKRLIEASSNPTDVVLDPFAGSGETCRVASILGRRFIGIEKNASFHHKSVKAVSQPSLNDYVRGGE